MKFYFATYRTTSVGAFLRAPIVTGSCVASTGARGVARSRIASASCEAAPGCGAHREKEKQRHGSWHVSRLSVFTEIPCTLRPITFVTDYSTKVSHRAARAETYPDKLHRANRQCSQMEPEARARDSSNSERAAFADPTITPKTSEPVTLNFLPLQGGFNWERYTRARWTLKHHQWKCVIKAPELQLIIILSEIKSRPLALTFVVR